MTALAMKPHHIGVLPIEDNSHLDDRDTATAARIATALAANIAASPDLPLAGELIVLANGKTAVISHVWNWDGDPLNLARIQTSPGGSVHIGERGFGSFSGGMDPGVMQPFLRLTGDTAPATFWMWHHGRAAAHNGVDVHLPVRVWAVDVTAARRTVVATPPRARLCRKHAHPTYDGRDDTCPANVARRLYNDAARIIEGA